MNIPMTQIKVFLCWTFLFFLTTHLSAKSDQPIEVKEAYKYIGETKNCLRENYLNKIPKKSIWWTNFFKFWKRLSKPTTDRFDMVW